jgi:hypothetical protein
MDQRRKFDRVHLRCAVVLWNPREGTVTQAETENISCEGFYFLCGTAFAPGDELEATIQLSPGDSKDNHHVLALQCQVEVKWTKPTLRGEYGIGCRIRTYALVGRRPRERAQVSGA